jgi:PAS domain-containing protein
LFITETSERNRELADLLTFDGSHQPPLVMSLHPVRGAAQLQVLFDQLADAVYLLDPATSDIVWGNRKAWESLGLSREAVLDHSALSLQKDVHGMPQWSEIADAIRATDCYRFNGRHRHADGHGVVM